jgi:hypothetical protein
MLGSVRAHDGTTVTAACGRARLKISMQDEFGPIRIGLPTQWPGLQMTLNRITLYKDERYSYPIIGLARFTSKSRLDERPEEKLFFVVGDENQLATANKQLAPLLDGKDLRHGNKFLYSQLLAFDEHLNGQERARNAAIADALDLLPPAIEIDAAYFKGMVPSNNAPNVCRHVQHCFKSCKLIAVYVNKSRRKTCKVLCVQSCRKTLTKRTY